MKKNNFKLMIITMLCLLPLVFIQCDIINPKTGNRAPAIRKMSAEPAEAYFAQKIRISVDAVDPDGDQLTYTWNPSAGVIPNPEPGSNTVQWSAPGVAGDYSIEVTVTDAKGLSATKTLGIPVVSNNRRISNLIVNTDRSEVSLRWENPRTDDFKAVRVVRKQGSHPIGPDDGESVYQGGGTSFKDTSLEDGKKYFYSVFVQSTDSKWGEKAPTEGVPGTPVSSVTVDQTRLSVVRGQSKELRAAVLPTDAVNKTVIWSSSSAGVATVSASGRVHAIAPGTTEIIARSESNNDIFGRSAVTVTEIPIILTTAEVTGIKSTEAVSGGTITDNGATVTARGVAWSTSPNPTIAGNHTTDGSGTGTFRSRISDLRPGTRYYLRSYATGIVGTVYGQQITFTTASIPVVSTAPVRDIASTSAVSGGTIANNGAVVSARGVAWGTSPNPTIAGPHTTDGSGTGSFTSRITGLTMNTGYHVRAYATGPEGTVYGRDIPFRTNSLPSVSTAPVTKITSTTAVSGGTIADNGARVTERGVVWSTSPRPTLADPRTRDGSGTGTFTSRISGLSPGTTYYVRAYATGPEGTAFGAVVIFRTRALPVVSTAAVTEIKSTSAESGGTIADNGATVTARGVAWGTSPNPTIAGRRTTDGTGTGSFTSRITGLTARTDYYVRAYATGPEGTVYGSDKPFTTAAVPAISTAAVTEIKSTGAVSGGTITDNGAAVTARGVAWGTRPNPTISGPHTTDGRGPGIFTSRITGLSAGTRYYVRAYATGEEGTVYGDQKDFPAAMRPSVSTAAVSNITVDSAVSGGTIADNGARVSARGVAWGTRPNPTIAGDHTTDGSGTGAFTSQITRLRANTDYYVRAYATDAEGTVYGRDVSFKTADRPPAPVISITGISSDSTDSAVVRVTIADNGARVTERGVVWSTSSNPMTSGSRIPDDGSGTGSFTVRITGLTAGTRYYVRAYAVSSEGTVYGGDVEFTTKVVDLQLSGTRVNNNRIEAGHQLTISTTVRNAGTGSSDSTTVRFYRSSDATITSGDASVGSESVRSLSAGGSANASKTVTVPSSPGTYYYGAIVEAVTGETNSGNNASSGIQVTVFGKPDLIVSNIRVSKTSLTPGERFTIYATVKNEGNGSSPSTRVDYYRSSDSTITTGDSYIDYYDNVSGLSPGESSDESYRITAPSTPGTYYYGAVVRSVSGESNTDNNASSGVRVTVTGTPRLIISSIRVSKTSLAPGESFTIYATVKNDGNGSSTSTRLNYYRSSDSTISSSDTYVDYDNVSSLSPGRSSNESERITAPSSPGTYYYGAVVGNSASSGVRVTVAGTPHLVISSISVSKTLLTPGQSFTIYATVKNDGTGSSTSTRLNYYRSSNSTISTSDALVDYDNVNSLSPGRSSNVSESITAPSDPGTYYYGAVVGNSASSGVRVIVTTYLGQLTSSILKRKLTERDAISSPGEVDWFSFNATRDKTLTYYIETKGDTDTTGELYDPNGTRLDSDDDSGKNRNFKIEKRLGRGLYFIKIYGYNSTTGDYEVQVTEPWDGHR